MKTYLYKPIKNIKYIGIKRVCTTCGIEKPLTEFRSKIRGWFGKGSCCKGCTSKYERKRLHKVRQNPEKYERTLEKARLWRKNNPEKERAKAKRNKLRIMSTPEGILNRRISTGMRLSLKNGKQGYCWESLVGYTVEVLKKHIEKRFLPGMSWENTAKWHIDHKIPIAAFNFETPGDIDFKRCWALKNLRPLWAVDNQKKRDKVDRPFQPSLSIAV